MKHYAWLYVTIILFIGCQRAKSEEEAASQIRNDIMLIDAEAHCGSVFSPPTVCPEGTEWFNNLCVTKCPIGHFRSGLCSCETGRMIWDCDTYAPRDSEVCREDEETVGRGICQKKCPDNMKRAGKCGCGEAKATEDCEKYGSVSTPTCEKGLELFMGVCLKASCPKGWKRASCSTCFKVDEIKVAPKTGEDIWLKRTDPTNSVKKDATDPHPQDDGNVRASLQPKDNKDLLLHSRPSAGQVEKITEIAIEAELSKSDDDDDGYDAPFNTYRGDKPGEWPPKDVAKKIDTDLKDEL